MYTSDPKYILQLPHTDGSTLQNLTVFYLRVFIILIILVIEIAPVALNA